MADYWKSQPRKFCQYCKCWIADNKPSIEFHERGKNHKENVAAKISEIKKKSIDKAKQEEKMSKEFAAMEEAAMKAYQEDLKRMEMEAAGLSAPAPKPVAAAPKPQVKPQVKPQPKKHHKKEKASKTVREPREAQVWVEGQSDEGHTYYYNTVTGESQWEKPAGFMEQSYTSAQPAQTESSSASSWMEAISPEGFTYYYNTDTGESSWEKPADFPSNEAAQSEPSKDETEEEASTTQKETQEEEGKEASKDVAEPQESEVPEQTDQQPKVPKISFRKRKAEAEPSEKEDKDEKVEDAPKEGAEETKTDEEIPSTTAEPEKKEEKVVQAKRPKASTPYGAWEQIQEEADPFADVDLQLPQVEGSTAGAPSDLPPEPKPKFKERIITSLGEGEGPASFRKNKTQNGKSRSLRQRDNDD